MALTAVAETYVSCTGYAVTIGTSAVGEVHDGGFDHEKMVDEMTTLGGGGGYEDVGTVDKVTGTVVISWKNATSPALVPGAIYLLVIDGGAGNPYLSCNARFAKASYPLLDPKKGVKVTYSFTSQGVITRTRPA